MSKATQGNAQTLYTTGHGFYGIRARVALPTDFVALGFDSAHYFDAYVAMFVDDKKTAYVEAGPMYQGELHLDKKTGAVQKAWFAGTWSIGVNPAQGGFKGQPRQGERNMPCPKIREVTVELTISAPDQAAVLVNGKPFKTPNTFTYGFDGGRGVNAATFDKGFNVKTCIGLNDIGGRGVHFKDMSIEVTQVLRNTKHGKVWGPPPTLHPYMPLSNTKTTFSGPKLTVSYPSVTPAHAAPRVG